MTRPGVEITSLAQAPPRSAPTETGTAFMVAATDSGEDVKLVRSLTEYESEFGVRTGYVKGWDYADAYFREGGTRLYVSRLNPGVGLMAAEEPDLEAMTREELDAYAAEQGVTDPASLPNKQAVVDALDELEAPEALVVDPTIQAALDRLNADYGPGQVFVADALATAPDTHAALLAHCVATNRVALLEAPDGTAASLITFGTALQGQANGRYGALFAPNAILPGLASGTTRQVGYPPVEAGIIARNDLAFTANVPSAGDLGKSAYALDLTYRYTDQEYEDLNEAGVDLARVIYGQVETYGYRSAVAPDGADAGWLSFGNARLNMAIVAQAEVIAQRYVFAEIDGRGKKIAQFGAELRAMLVPFYEAGALYGETADDAFAVNVGNQVNTPETIADGELHAVIEARMSPFAEMVVIEIVKVATTVAIAA